MVSVAHCGGPLCRSGPLAVILRLLATAALAALCCAGTVWGYHHAIALRIERGERLAHAVTRARDMQHLADFRALRRCQTRVMMDNEYMETANMVAHSALRQAGMAR